jgi:hypothetical protein
MITKADRLQGLQSESEAGDRGEPTVFGSSRKACRLKMHEQPMFQIKFKGRNKLMFHLEGSQAGALSDLGDSQPFLFFRPHIVKDLHIREDSLLYSFF